MYGKNSRMVIVSKWHSKISHGMQQHLPNTLRNNSCAQIHLLYYKDPLAADDGSRKNSTTLERQTGENNEVNDVSVRGFPIDAGRR